MTCDTFNGCARCLGTHLPDCKLGKFIFGKIYLHAGVLNSIYKRIFYIPMQLVGQKITERTVSTCVVAAVCGMLAGYVTSLQEFVMPAVIP